MSFKIKLDPADRIFSQYIRLRDGHCKRCHSKVEINDKRLPVSHEASHFFGRGQESVRFDPENVDTLCCGCHKIWGGRDREDYRLFKMRQLGQRGFDSLLIRSKIPCKRDRKLALIKANELLKSLNQKGEIF